MKKIMVISMLVQFAIAASAQAQTYHWDDETDALIRVENRVDTTEPFVNWADSPNFRRYADPGEIRRYPERETWYHNYYTRTYGYDPRIRLYDPYGLTWRTEYRPHYYRRGTRWDSPARYYQQDQTFWEGIDEFFRLPSRRYEPYGQYYYGRRIQPAPQFFTQSHSRPRYYDDSDRYIRQRREFDPAPRDLYGRRYPQRPTVYTRPPPRIYRFKQYDRYYYRTPRYYPDRRYYTYDTPRYRRYGYYDRRHYQPLYRTRVEPDLSYDSPRERRMVTEEQWRKMREQERERETPSRMRQELQSTRIR